MKIKQYHTKSAALVKVSEELTKASILVPDRTVLFNLIEGQNYQLEKNKPIFIKKIPIENDLRQKKNSVIYNQEIKKEKNIDENIINKGYIITTSRSKRSLPIKYQLY